MPESSIFTYLHHFIFMCVRVLTASMSVYYNKEIYNHDKHIYNK